MHILLLIIYGILLGILLYGINWFRNILIFQKEVNKYPGKPANFFLGDVLQLSRKLDVLFKQFREYAKEFPEGYRLYSGLFGSYNFIKAEDFEVILSSSKHIEKESVYVFFNNWLGQGLLTSGGEKWHQRRKILTPAFHFNVLRRFVNVFAEHSDEFVKKLKDECNKSKTNIMPLITNLTLDLISETAMGVRLEQNNKKQEEYRKAIYEMGELVVNRTVSPWYFYDCIYQFFPKGRRYFKNIKLLHQFTYEVIKERERNFKDSDVENLDKDTDEDYSSFTKKRFAMLDLLISAKRNTGEITDTDIREEVDTFMFEGHDTTSMALTFALLCLANYKDVQAKVHQELDEIFQDSDRSADYNDLQEMQYLEIVLKEVLRLYPSVPFISRTLKEDVPIRNGKYVMPKTVFVHMHIYDLHRDPTVFPDPEKFDPNRFLPENIKKRSPYSYVPFSAGPRNCIGQRFAMLEMKSVLSSVLRNYEIDPVDTPETISIKVDLVLRPKSVYVKFKPRKHEKMM